MNMNNPFQYIDEAFAPFYDEEIVVECKDGRRQTLLAYVCLDNTGDALADEMVDSDREDIVVNARKSDWCFLKTLERGDRIKRPFLNRVYSVSEVTQDYSLGLIVKAKSVKCR